MDDEERTILKVRQKLSYDKMVDVCRVDMVSTFDVVEARSRGGSGSVYENKLG